MQNRLPLLNEIRFSEGSILNFELKKQLTWYNSSGKIPHPKRQDKLTDRKERGNHGSEESGKKGCEEGC